MIFIDDQDLLYVTAQGILLVTGAFRQDSDQADDTAHITDQCHKHPEIDHPDDISQCVIRKFPDKNPTIKAIRHTCRPRTGSDLVL